MCKSSNSNLRGSNPTKPASRSADFTHYIQIYRSAMAPLPGHPHEGRGGCRCILGGILHLFRDAGASTGHSPPAVPHRASTASASEPSSHPSHGLFLSARCLALDERNMSRRLPALRAVVGSAASATNGRHLPVKYSSAPTRCKLGR